MQPYNLYSEEEKDHGESHSLYMAFGDFDALDGT